MIDCLRQNARELLSQFIGLQTELCGEIFYGIRTTWSLSHISTYGQTTRPRDSQITAALLAGFTVIGLGALSRRLRLGHVLAFLGLAVPLVARTVIHLRALVDPHFACAPARRGRNLWR